MPATMNAALPSSVLGTGLPAVAQQVLTTSSEVGMSANPILQSRKQGRQKPEHLPTVTELEGAETKLRLAFSASRAQAVTSRTTPRIAETTAV